MDIGLICHPLRRSYTWSSLLILDCFSSHNLECHTTGVGCFREQQSWGGSYDYFQVSSVVSDSWQPHGLQYARPPCPSPTPRVYSNSCPLSWWYHPTISSSVIPFSSCLQSFPASGSFQMSQFFTSGGQSIPSIAKTKFSTWKGS